MCNLIGTKFIINEYFMLLEDVDGKIKEYIFKCERNTKRIELDWIIFHHCDSHDKKHIYQFHSLYLFILFYTVLFVKLYIKFFVTLL